VIGSVLLPWAPLFAAFGIGIAVASAPGPVQAILLGEAVRGGVRNGLQALVGVHLTFGGLLVALALGVSVVRPDPLVVGLLQIVGGGVLVWLGVNAFRATSPPRSDAGDEGSNRRLPPLLRGAIAVVVFPGTWLFLAGVASPLLATARQPGGTAMAVAAAVALVVGAIAGDAAVVVVGGLALKGAQPRTVMWVRRGLALGLGGIGVILLVAGVSGIVGLHRWT
jgi:threonine/homoserine/homoserine lactone efflux protein